MGFQVDEKLHGTEKEETELCRILMKTGALKFGMFKLTSGKLSPYYVDLRSIPSHPESFRRVIEIYEKLVKDDIGIEEFDRISCVPTSGLLFASVLAFQLYKPILYSRKEKKTHGRERRIEGVVTPGDRIVIVDDLITTGKSLVDAIDVLRAEGGIVTDAVVLIDRQEGGKAQLQKSNVKLHSFMSMTEIASIMYQLGVIEEGKYNEILEQSDKKERLD